MSNAQFIGSWRLVSWQAHHSDGTVTYPLGEEANGMITYDAAGNMSVQIYRAGRPPFAANDPFGSTATEAKVALGGMLAYWGTYSVDEQARVVTHVVRDGSIPNWRDTSQKRFFEFAGDRLTLSAAPMALGGITSAHTLVWERIG